GPHRPQCPARLARVDRRRRRPRGSPRCPARLARVDLKDHE
ncbi:hypothetical protein HMPREF9005_2111, partial [Actinomyces sp. oral taxon 178 str. F0338]